MIEDEHIKVHVSSPTATGGGGTTFEQHVVAYFLSLLLVKAYSPVFPSAVVDELALQTNYLGWHTDDLLLSALGGDGKSRRLLIQAKRSLTVGGADEEFKKTIVDSWLDWKNPQLDRQYDRICFIVQLAPKSLSLYLGGLFELARSSSDALDFKTRLTTKGFADKRLKTNYDFIATIVSNTDGQEPDEELLWQYLSALYLISMDLATASKLSEATAKSLLAFTASDVGVDAADRSWNELVTEATMAIPAARKYRYEDLPESARKRHAPFADKDKAAINAASDHTKLVLETISTGLHNGIRVNREDIRHVLLNYLETENIVLVTGAAGTGKSAIAKEALEALAGEYTAFAFHAEEFDKPHFDDVLKSAQIDIAGSKFMTLTASQQKKILLIESAERLTDAKVSRAFSELMDFVSKDQSWKIIITCRSNLAEQIKSKFFEQTHHTELLVPLLSDDELKKLAEQKPELGKLFHHPPLKQLLRNLFYLSKSLQVKWTSTESLPENERALRQKLWREIIQVDSFTAEEMPVRRQETFIRISKQKAQNLTTYVLSTDLDHKALSALRKDCLVVSPLNYPNLISPEHDVLEDWAILTWLDGIFTLENGSLLALAEAIGTCPSYRRTYRRWIAELIDAKEVDSMELLQELLSDVTLPSHFFDDSLIGLLQGLESVDFLRHHRRLLFKNDKELFHKIIKLLRVASMKAPDWMPEQRDIPSAYLQPEGMAWQSLLGFVSEELAEFSETDWPTLQALLTDWSRSISIYNPYPEGAKYAAKIVLDLLAKYDEKNLHKDKDKDSVRELIDILSKLPLCEPTEFSRICSIGNAKNLSGILRLRILDGFACTPCSRDIPEQVVSIANEVYKVTGDEEPKNTNKYSYTTDLQFGLRESKSVFSNASAFRGPFLQLLRFHPKVGIDFVVSFVNYAFECFVVTAGTTEDIQTDNLKFDDGTLIQQYSDFNFWSFYRGAPGNAPVILMSALMALEHWLLEQGRENGDSLDQTLIEILRCSNNCAIAAVVASVATAYPHLSIRTISTFVRCRNYILFDRHRMANESVATYRHFITGLNPSQETQIQAKERRLANGRPHRQQELAVAIMACQFTSSANFFQEAIDHYLADLPASESQTEEDMIWRILLHCMDLRKHKLTPVEDSEQSRLNGQTLVEPGEPDEELARHIEEATARGRILNERLSIESWARSAFDGDEDCDTSLWQHYLTKCQSQPVDQSEDLNIGKSSLPLVAGLCIRDHWNQVTDEERTWCIQTICNEAQRLSSEYDRSKLMTETAEVDETAARILPMLLDYKLSAAEYAKVQQSLIAVIAHSLHKVRRSAAFGLSKLTSPNGQLFANQAIRFWCLEAKIMTEHILAQREAPFSKRRLLSDILKEVNQSLQQGFLENPCDWFTTYNELDLNEAIAARNNILILQTLSSNLLEHSLDVFFHSSSTIAASWNHSNRFDPDFTQDIEEVTTSTQLLAGYLLDCKKSNAIALIRPIVEAVDDQPSDVASFLLELLNEQLKQSRNENFWPIWESFAEKLSEAKWLIGLNSEDSFGSELIRAVFFTIPWHEGRKSWDPLVGNESIITNLFDKLPPSECTLSAYLNFLYRIGESALPQAFIQIGKILKVGDLSLISQTDSTFLLEAILRRWIYGKADKLRKNREVKEAVIALLDALVAIDSSAGYRMREDFLLPSGKS